MSDWTLLALAVALCLILIGIAVALVLTGPGTRRGRDPRSRPERSSFRRGGEKRTPRRAGIIINPTKFDDVAAVRQELTEASRALDWAEPLFIETTIDDPGTGQARVAIEEMPVMREDMVARTRGKIAERGRLILRPAPPWAKRAPR